MLRNHIVHCLRSVIVKNGKAFHKESILMVTMLSMLLVTIHV